MTDREERFNFPKGIERVTGGKGGETILIFATDKTVMMDCGMAYCRDETIKRMEEKLREHGREKPDLILLSHSHYDHIGALPYIKRRWPEAIVMGAQKCKEVFESPGARATMKRLGEFARDAYGNEEQKKAEILVEPLNVDIVIHDGDRICLSGGTGSEMLLRHGEAGCISCGEANSGSCEEANYRSCGEGNFEDCAEANSVNSREGNSGSWEKANLERCSEEYIYVLETKGHTDCSLTFVYEPDDIMFASESTGVMRDRSYIHTAMLKSGLQTIASAEKCKKYGAKRIISPHYGIVPEDFTEQYFDLYMKIAKKEMKEIIDFYKAAGTEEGAVELYTQKYWNEEREKEQPKAAFLANAWPIIKNIIKEQTR